MDGSENGPDASSPSVDDDTSSVTVPPLDVDAVRTVQVGTAIWAVLLVAQLPFRDELAADDRAWWLWTCVVGVVFGLIGIAFTTRRRRRRATG